MYRAIIENILGFDLTGDKFLRIDPCITRDWREFEIKYRRGETEFQIKVENPSGIYRGVVETRLDGDLLKNHEILLTDDRQIHRVRVTLGSIES